MNEQQIHEDKLKELMFFAESSLVSVIVVIIFIENISIATYIVVDLIL